MTDYRVERDFLGELKVPKDAYWGAQTQRAIENFPISGIRFGTPPSASSNVTISRLWCVLAHVAYAPRFTTIAVSAAV